MSNFGHIQRVTTSVGGRVLTFRSKLEYRYAVYLQLLKDAGEIQDWVYEPQDMAIEFEHGRRGNTRGYLPDFGVLNNDGDWEVHETKGRFMPLDYKKLISYTQQYANPITLIFGKLADTKSHRAQYNRAKKLEPHIKRIIWNADKQIFARIKYLFTEG